MPPVDIMMRKYQRELSQIVNSPAFRQLVTLAIIALSIAFLIDRFNRARHPPINPAVRPNDRNQANRNIQTTAVGRLLSSITQSSNQSTALVTPSQKYFTTQSKANRRSVIITSDCLLFDDQHSLNQTIKQTIKQLSSACRVVILHQCHEDDDESELELINNLTINQLIGSEVEGLIPSHRVVSCTTEKGAIAIIRQLEPALLIAGSTSIIQSVKPFIVDCLIIDSNTKVKSFTPPNLYPINTINGLTNYSITSATHASRTITTLASIDQWFNGVKQEPTVSPSKELASSIPSSSLSQSASLSQNNDTAQ